MKSNMISKKLRNNQKNQKMKIITLKKATKISKFNIIQLFIVLTNNNKKLNSFLTKFAIKTAILDNLNSKLLINNRTIL